MKKKSNKKKLPRYNIGYAPQGLGSRKPRTLGYQPNQGIGNVHFEQTQGEDITPEVKAMRANQIPNALSKLSQNATYPVQMLQNLKTIPITTTTTLAPTLASTAIPAASIAPAATSSLAQQAAATTGGRLLTGAGMQQVGQTAAEQAGKTVTTQIGTKTALSTAGKVLGGIGAAYGLYNIGSDIANSGEHRSAGDMLKTRNKTTVTTAGGNQYDEYSGINGNAEMAYENQARTAKQVGLTTDAMGFGASAGGLVGSIIPGVGTLLGTGIGAGLGALAGGIASLFGFGDNSDEVEEALKNATDWTTRQNRQSRSSALSEDMKSAFYNRAANGKQPVWTPAGLASGKATARVSNGELIGNFEDGYVSRVPGKKNNKDTKLAALKASDFVISNKYGLSDYAAATGDYVGALNMQNQIMNKKYKNGKLPGFVNGWADYALTSLPHLGSSMINLMGYNRARNADTYAPDTYVDNAEGRAAVNELARLRFDATPYLTDAQRALNQANWSTRRNVGLGIGGRAIAQNANFMAYLDGLRKIRTQENEANAGYTQAYANALANLGANNQARRMESLIRKHGWQQQANAAKENAMSKYLAGMQDSWAKGAKDYLSMRQYNQSLGIQEKMLGLYQQQVDLDKLKYLNSLNDRKSSSTRSTSTASGIPLSTVAKMTTKIPTSVAFSPSLLSAYTRPAIINGLEDNTLYNGGILPEVVVSGKKKYYPSILSGQF